MPPADRMAAEQALEWLVVLGDTAADDPLRDEFDDWLARSEQNRTAWLAALHTWETLDQTRAAAGPAAINVVAMRPRKPVWPRVLAAITSVAAAIALVALMPHLLVRLEADHVTGVAEVQVVTLADGSEVTLGGGSAIAVDLSGTARHVRLLQGEAYFDVQPDVTRPFVVDAEGVETTVLGTAFDVRLSGAAVSVAVAHGSVRVDEATPSDAPLGAGDWVEVAPDGSAHRGTMAPELVGSWRQGRLSVQNQTIGAVLNVAQRYFAGAVLVTDQALLAETVSGVYDLTEPEKALRAAVEVYGGRVQQVTPWVMLVTR